MLDDYKQKQQIIYKILKNAIRKNEYSHAYLFETNNYYDSFNFILSFVKSLLCPKKNFNKENCGDCHQCEVIESGNFPEIKIINPDGMWIKKDQLKDLQKEFSEKALIGNKRIYIINHAEKLNKSAANSILKFLEEPDNNIIAILITENIYNVIETIRSRCQILRFKSSDIIENNKKEALIKQIQSNHENELEISEIEEKISKAIEFIDYYEENGKDTLLYMNKLWNENFKSKEEIVDAFQIIILYYSDIINIKLNKKSLIFDNNESIKKIIKNNSIKKLCKKINILIESKETVKYNVNSNLLMDKLILDMEGVK